MCGHIPFCTARSQNGLRGVLQVTEFSSAVSCRVWRGRAWQAGHPLREQAFQITRQCCHSCELSNLATLDRRSLGSAGWHASTEAAIRRSTRRPKTDEVSVPRDVHKFVAPPMSCKNPIGILRNECTPSARGTIRHLVQRPAPTGTQERKISLEK